MLRRAFCDSKKIHSDLPPQKSSRRARVKVLDRSMTRRATFNPNAPFSILRFFSDFKMIPSDFETIPSDFERFVHQIQRKFKDSLPQPA